jgi:cell division protein FtsZ
LRLKLIEAGLKGVEYIAVSVTQPRLRKSRSGVKICIGTGQGFGTGGDPGVARDAAEESREELSAQFAGADLVFVAAGMGSGTGTGAAPVVAALAREAGALVVGIVTKPFGFEGKQRMLKAEAGIAELDRHADCLITIPNDRLAGSSGKGVSLVDAFKPAHTILRQAVQGIAELVNECGYINADFNDMKTIMSLPGKSLIGMGSALGPNRAAEAVGMAINSPLVEDNDIQGAQGILVDISGSAAMTMEEFDLITKTVYDKADADAVFIVGMVVREDPDDSIQVMVIATGLEGGALSAGKNRLRLV